MKKLHFLALCLFFALFSLNSCKKDSDDSSNTPTPSTADFYWQATVDGQAVTIELTPTNNIEMGTSNGGSIGTDNCIFDYGAYIGPNDPTQKPSADVEFSSFFDGDCGTESSVFNDLFAVKSYSYLAENSASKGIILRWSDASGDYSTELGTQSGSNFNITKSEDANDIFGYAQNITGTFKCTVYTETGAKKEITNGQFRLNYRAWF
jgi:hypothetical protein